jgi:lysophospholipase L1-like esterase
MPLPSRSARWKAGIAIAVAGLLLAVLLLEGLLRLSGWVIQAGQSRSNPRLDFRRDEFRIVALGESTTAQVWSDGRENSWVGQLETLLNEASLGYRIKIINMAVGGTSSPFLVQRLEASLSALKPHAVISMMGINDHMQYEYLHDRGLKSLRLIKLGRWTLRAIKTHAPSQAFSPEANREKFLKIRKALRTNPPWDGARKPADLKGGQDFIEAVASRHEPKRWLVYQAASGEFYARHDQEKNSPEFNAALLRSCRHYARRALEIAPLDVVSLRMLLYCTGTDEVERKQTHELLKRSLAAGVVFDETIRTLLPNVGVQLESERKGLDLGGVRSWHSVTQGSYRRLADLLRANDVAYLAMQYPTGNPDAIRNYFALHPRFDFESHAESLYAEFENQEILPQYRGVFVIGNENFNNIVTAKNASEYYTDFFIREARFGHTTSKGHALIARNAAQYIIAHWPDILASAKLLKSP